MEAMKAAVVFLFCLLSNFPSINAGKSDDICSLAISCVSAEVTDLFSECLRTVFTAKVAENKNYEEELDCDKLPGAELDKCVAKVVELGGETTDCVLTKTGVMNAEKQIDLEAMKKYALDRTNLTDAQKAAAKSTFDGCMLTKPPSPYTLLHYKPENLPAPLQMALPLLREAITFRSATPAVSFVAIECMGNAVMQNGCSSVTKEMADDLVKKWNKNKKQKNEEKKQAGRV